MPALAADRPGGGGAEPRQAERFGPQFALAHVPALVGGQVRAGPEAGPGAGRLANEVWAHVDLPPRVTLRAGVGG